MADKAEKTVPTSNTNPAAANVKTLPKAEDEGFDYVLDAMNGAQPEGCASAAWLVAEVFTCRALRVGLPDLLLRTPCELLEHPDNSYLASG